MRIKPNTNISDAFKIIEKEFDSIDSKLTYLRQDFDLTGLDRLEKTVEGFRVDLNELKRLFSIHVENQDKIQIFIDKQTRLNNVYNTIIANNE